MKNKQIQHLIALAFEEDLGDLGDLTIQSFLKDKDFISMNIVARESLVISGIKIVEEVFHYIDDSVQVQVCVSEGQKVEANVVLARLQGSLGSLFSAERICLNFLQHLSGIATLTRRFVDAVEDLPVQILDTRKTIPAWRFLEKQAVKSGGGVNHRFGLFDKVMLKDNHLAYLSKLDLKKKVLEFSQKFPKIKVQLEADTIGQALEFLQWQGVESILLDNMNTSDLLYIVKKRKGKVPLLEASGGVSLESVRQIAETGVDFISVGALTHSAKAVDIAMDYVS